MQVQPPHAVSHTAWLRLLQRDVPVSLCHDLPCGKPHLPIQSSSNIRFAWLKNPDLTKGYLTLPVARQTGFTMGLDGLGGNRGLTPGMLYTKVK